MRELTCWGAILDCPAAATGRFRALWSEMLSETNGHDGGRELGYTGSACNQCGGSRMVRVGACESCQDCGTSTGCT